MPDVFCCFEIAKEGAKFQIAQQALVHLSLREALPIRNFENNEDLETDSTKLSVEKNQLIKGLYSVDSKTPSFYQKLTAGLELRLQSAPSR